MTWKEFKNIVDRQLEKEELSDEIPLSYIDYSSATGGIDDVIEIYINSNGELEI
jgi:hypothetical protein